MSQQPQILKPRTLNLDSSPKYLKETESPFLLNYDVLNPSALGKGVPFAANISLCEVDMPEGENYATNAYHSPITGETYSWHFNSNGMNYIQRVNQDGVCDIVYHNDGIINCLKLSIDPKHTITQWRAYLYVEKTYCANRDGKYLIWTDGLNVIGYIDVEASIATDSFASPFFDNCFDGCEALQLCVPQPLDCISAEYVDNEDANAADNISNKAFKFSYRWIYYDLRASEWADPSTLMYEDVHSCFDNSTGTPNCIRLKIPMGNPLVERIEVAYSKGDVDSNGNGIWFLSDTIDKYKKYNSTQQKWYERQLNDRIVVEGCYVEYTFCNNKQCQAIDFTEFSRVYNPIPLEAQALILIDGGLGFVNYKQGTCSIDKTEVDKFSITPNYDNASDCVPEMVSLKVRAVIHSLKTNINQFVWRKKGAVGDEDDITDTAIFGGFQDTTVVGSTVSVINDMHEQEFAGSIRNFIVYVEGTEYFAQMKQCKSGDSFSTPNFVGVLSGASVGADFISMVNDTRQDGGFYYLEGEILRPKGMSGVLRLCSHKATGLQPDTSTKVAGVIDDINSYVTDSGLTNFHRYQFEIPFSCADTELLSAFIIDDASLIAADGNHSSVETVGYVKDNIGTPLEGLEIWYGLDDPSTSSSKRAQTDHNGYFYAYNFTGKVKNSTAQIRGETDCSTWNKIQSIGLNRTQYGITSHADTVIANSAYLNKRFTIARVMVKDCNNNPIKGVTVAFSGSKAQTTLSDGTAIIKARNYSTRNRFITAYVMGKYGCMSVDCAGNCNPCSVYSSKQTPACYNGTTVSFNDMVISIASALKHSVGLKAGGEYPFGFVVQWACSKISSVNELPSITIDKTQKKGKFGFATFNYDASGINLPEDAEVLKIVRGVNLNDYELQWIVDKIEKTPDRKIKLTIQSLNDYNARYFFKTNTNYQYQQGDRVEFIRNGDGTIFNSITYGILNYQILSPFLDQQATGSETSPANYFNQILIEDNGKLDNLKEGALIELQRSKECITQPVYFSICASIPIINGKLVAEKGNFSTFDTFFVQRQIGSFSVQTFEHKTPSDFWGGQSIDDTGKAYFVNKYENEKRYGRNISIGSPTQINYFGDLVKTFDAPEQGDITAANIVDGRIILAIGESDNFLAQASNDLLKVGSDGLIRAASPDQIISDAEPKVRGRYGCKYEDIGSVLFGDGFATWVDGDKNAHVVHNYSEAIDISVGKAQSFFRNKISMKNLTNGNTSDDAGKVRWIIGQNKVNNSVLLTVKSLISEGVYGINDSPRTIIFDPLGKTYLTFASFAPDCYSSLNLLSDIGSAFIVYQKGIPYLHPVEANGKFNEFFGQSVDMAVEVVFNKYSEKLKNFISLEIQDISMWYAETIETDSDSFLSEIPPIRVEQLGNKWNAGFLGNIKSLDGLYGNQTPSGYYVKALLVRDNTDGLKYKTIDDVKRTQYSELDLVIAKFNFSEQSGFTENL